MSWPYKVKWHNRGTLNVIFKPLNSNTVSDLRRKCYVPGVKTHKNHMAISVYNLFSWSLSRKLWRNTQGDACEIKLVGILFGNFPWMFPTNLSFDNCNIEDFPILRQTYPNYWYLSHELLYRFKAHFAVAGGRGYKVKQKKNFRDRKSGEYETIMIVNMWKSYMCTAVKKRL